LGEAVAQRKKVLIAGASGIVGTAAMRRFARDSDWEVLAASRHPPPQLPPRTTHLALDLSQPIDEKTAANAFADVTHLVYAAVAEGATGLIAGWHDEERMQLNLRMLRHVLDPLCRHAHGLRHVSLMQGTKAYGAHLPGAKLSVPLRESLPRHPHANFYWLHQDYLSERQAGTEWSWTIFRPPMIVGEAMGSSTNVLLALGIYAALQRETHAPFAYPGARSPLAQALDANLLGDALVWAAEAPAARNEIFNLENGEIFAWRDLWTVIGREFGLTAMDGGPATLSEAVKKRGDEWGAIVKKYGLTSSPDLTHFAGGSFELADLCLGALVELPPSFISTIKLRRAGFTSYVDTEEMVVSWLRRYREMRWLP